MRMVMVVLVFVGSVANTQFSHWRTSGHTVPQSETLSGALHVAPLPLLLLDDGEPPVPPDDDPVEPEEDDEDAMAIPDELVDDACPPVPDAVEPPPPVPVVDGTQTLSTTWPAHLAPPPPPHATSAESAGNT